LISIYNVLLNLIFTFLLNRFTNCFANISIIKLMLLWSARLKVFLFCNFSYC
jgi:hypothetical protein